MIKLSTILITLALSLSLSSCFCTYDITLRSNGSVHVEITDWESYDGETLGESAAGEIFYSEMDEFQKSPLVSNYKRTNNNGFFKISYDVSTVDSLHRYLWPPVDEHEGSTQTKFKLQNKTLTISQDLEENGPDEVTMYSEFLPLKVIMNFEDEIKSYTSDLDGTKQNSNFQIELNSNLRDLSYGEGTKTIKITFK